MSNAFGNPAPGSEHPSAELDDLLDALCERALSQAEVDRLESLAINDPAARAKLVELLQFDAVMRWESTDLGRAAPAISPHREAPKTIPIYRKGHEPKPTPFIIYPIAIAAAVLFTAAIVVVYLLTFTIDAQPDPIQPDQPGPPVATLIQNTGDLRTPHGYPAEGDDYSRGEYSLSSGTAEFMLTNAVNVKLHGETRMHMHNDMNVSLAHGSAEFVCPTDAKGFTVYLPDQTRVVDLGTRFNVSAPDDAEAHYVVVHEGRVSVYPASPETPAITLERGEAIRLLPGGGFEHLDTLNAQLIKDPGFENDRNATAWSFTGNAATRPGSHTAPVYAGRGVAVLNAGQTAPNGVIEQTIETVPSVTYRLSLAAALRTVRSDERAAIVIIVSDLDTHDTLASLRIELSRATRARGLAPDAFDPFHIDFVATGPRSVVRIVDRSPAEADAFDIVLDQIHVRAKPLDTNPPLTSVPIEEEPLSPLPPHSGDTP